MKHLYKSPLKLKKQVMIHAMDDTIYSRATYEEVLMGSERFWDNTQLVGFDSDGNPIRSNKPIQRKSKGNAYDIGF